MFDTYITRGEIARHYHNHCVIEKRAPTNESVRLLREMEQAALDKVLSNFKTTDCPVECSVVRMINPCSAQDTYYIRYSLNGVQREIEKSLCYAKIRVEGRQYLITELVKALAEDIACYILLPSFSKMMTERS